MARCSDVRDVVRWLVHQWERMQVELHGQYSVERLHSLYEYGRKRSLPCVLVVLVATPMPCLACIALIDLLPLEPLSVGFTRSYNFRLRSAIVTFVMAFTALEQYRQLIPNLRTSLRQILVMSLVTTVCSAFGAQLIASQLGFPIPFMMIVVSPVYMVVLTACIVVAWGKQLRQNKDVSRELQSYQIVVSLLFLLTLIYPAYQFVFQNLDSSAQTWFTLLLPVIKLGAKNAISPFCKFIEDYKPEAVIFNVEIFHALFVSICMQSTTSVRTTVLLMAMDSVQAALSVHDITVAVNRIIELRTPVLRASRERQQSSSNTTHASAEVGEVVDHILFLVKADAAIDRDNRSRWKTQETVIAGPTITKHQPKLSPSSVIPLPAQTVPVVSGGDASLETRYYSRNRATGSQLRRWRRGSVDFCPDQIPDTLPTSEKEVLMATLSSEERQKYVERTLQLLHIVEYVILIEYTEVIIPFVYSIYLLIVVRLPNIEFYRQLAKLTPDSLHSAISNVAIYALLELASFIMLDQYLYRKLQFSPLRMVGFVLERQWRLVQLKLCTWLLFMIQLSLVQFGMDFTFEFQWEVVT